jgi:hypothetical protein
VQGSYPRLGGGSEGPPAALGLDLEHHPELMQRPDIAAQVSAWFWQRNGLNELADKANSYEQFDKISNIINRLIKFVNKRVVFNICGQLMIGHRISSAGVKIRHFSEKRG